MKWHTMKAINNRFFQPFSWILFFVFSTNLVAQEDEACLPPDKKIVKLLENANKSQDSRVAATNFAKAIEAAPDNAMVTYEYAMYVYFTGLDLYETQASTQLGDRSFKKAEELFEQTIQLCNDYHANCTYFLGVINYMQKDNEAALKWFKQFIEFKHSDNKRYPDDYDEKLQKAKLVLKDNEKALELEASKVPFEPKKVKNVSSNNDEYFPMISPDNEFMFYTRKLNRANLGDLTGNIVEEFTSSRRNDGFTDFTTGEPLAFPFNDGSFSNYGAATVSVDNKEMIICACKKEKVYNQDYLNCDLYSTTFMRSEKDKNRFVWTPLRNLGDAINTKDGWEAQPSLSADGNTLYYTVARPTSRDNDIYISKRREDGTWEKARPFDEINTDGKDKSPFMHQDSETLYFVSSTSETRKGTGGLDIFYVRKENGKWGTPKNIGYPINSKEDEIGLFVSTDGKIAYYSSYLGGDWNIYSFELYEEARPKSVAIVQGDLTNEKGEAVEGATIEIAYEGSNEITKVKVNGNDGKYAAVVRTDSQKDVMVTVKKEGAAFDSKLLTKESFSKDTVVMKDVKLAVNTLKVGASYTINDILYATNSAELTARTKFILTGFIRFLEENPTIKVAIQGHTDDLGDDAANLQLSEKRAKGVAAYLESKGIAADRLVSKGFGETKPKVSNDSEENRAKNRRTDFVIQAL